MITPRSTERGFTLIELLIVVVVIGILASIAIPKFNRARDRAYESAVRSDLANMAIAMDVYYDDQYQYTTNLADAGITLSDGVTVTVNEVTPTGWAATATHQGLAPGAQCGLWYGGANSANANPATSMGIVDCTIP